MDILKNGSEQAAISLAPIEADMTLEEFLQSDLEGYEYVSSEDVVEGFSCQVAQLFE